MTDLEAKLEVEGWARNDGLACLVFLLIFITAVYMSTVLEPHAVCVNSHMLLCSYPILVRTALSTSLSITRTVVCITARFGVDFYPNWQPSLLL